MTARAVFRILGAAHPWVALTALVSALSLPPAVAQDQPDTEEHAPLLNEVKALIEANRLDELRPRVDHAVSIYPGCAIGCRAAWAAYRGAGHLGMESEDPREQERYHRIAYDASARTGNPRTRSRSLVFLSNLLLGQARLDEARDLIDAQVAAIPANDEFVPLLLLPLAEREVHERRFADALRHFAAIEASSPPAVKLARALGGRGQIALDLGRIEVAAEAFAREEAAIAADGIPPDQRALGLAISYLHRANLRLATDRSALLDRLVAEALANPELAQALPWLPSALRLRSAIGRMAEERLGNRVEPDSASIFREVLADPAATEPDRIGARLRLAHLATNAGDAPAAAAELALLPAGLGALDEAYRAALAARIARSGTAERAAAAAAELERSWERLVGNWSDEGAGDEGSGSLHYEQVRLLIAERIEAALTAAEGAAEDPEAGARAAFEILGCAGEVGTLHRALHAPRATLESVRSELIPPGGGIALFLPAADRSHLVLVDRERVSHHALPPRDAIERARRALAELRTEVPATAPATAERRTRHAAAARLLAERLLPAAAESRIAAWSTLTVVGLDLLGNFPVAELVLADGTALGDRTAIAALPSLSTGLALVSRADARVRGGPRRHGAALVAAPLLGETTRARFPAAEPLPLAEDAAAALLAGYPRREVEIGEAATLAGLAGALDGESAVLQLLLHGVRDPARLGRVSLLLAGEPDGVIGTEAAAALAVPPLVIVTACASGEGPLRLGDPGSVDWTGAFLLAGADAVIVATGDLGWSATLRRSHAIHEAIAAGATPAEALRRARLAEVAEGAVDAAHRFPLIVHGLGHRPVIPAGK